MSVKRLALAAIPLIGCGFLLSAGAQGGSAPVRGSRTQASRPVPVVVELFTSEGCSSCPPADELLADLARSQPVSGVDIIPLGEHVDYWNGLGWADPFSSAAFTERQQCYVQSFRLRSTYTPQMVVDGRQQFVGGNRARALQAIRQAAGEGKARVSVRPTGPVSADRAVSLEVNVTDLPRFSRGGSAGVFLALTENDLSSDVSRGENSGHKLQHHGVVRELRHIGGMDRSTGSFSARPTVTLLEDWKLADLEAVVFVQERSGLAILGAATTKLAVRP